MACIGAERIEECEGPHCGNPFPKSVGCRYHSAASAGYDADLPALPSEEENIKALKKLMPIGQDFGCSVIQRHLRIGYNRSFRLMEMMVESGDAVWETETRISFR